MQVEEGQSTAASLDTFDGVVVPTDSADQKALIVTLMRKLKLQTIESLEEEVQEAKDSAAQASTQLASARSAAARSRPSCRRRASRRSWRTRSCASATSS